MVDTLHPPYEVIASWPSPNYIDPHTRGTALAHLCTALSVVGTLIVSARLYSRLFITRAPGIDDALIVIALAFGIALSVLVCIGNTVWWSGHHIWDIPISKFAGHRLNIWNAEWCYVISTSMTKISVLLFYRRISIKFSKAFVIATWVGIIFNVLYMVAFCLVLLLLCRPYNAYWDSFSPMWVLTHPGNHCGKENIELPLSGVFSVIGDFYSALLPMIVIFNLNLSSRQKLSLYALFSLAFLIVAAGTARTILMYQMMNRDYDFTWVLWEMWVWGIVELYVGILAASAPALKPFLRKFLVEPLRSDTVMASSRGGMVGAMRSRQSLNKSKQSFYASHHSKRDANSLTKSRISVRESALIDDPENIGAAYGGMDSFTSRQECFDKEIDNDELNTRRYELQHSREGKIVAMQVWHQRPKSMRSISDRSRTNTNTTLSHAPVYRPVSMPAPVTPAGAGRGIPVLPLFTVPGISEGPGAPVRNFSLLYPYTAPSTPTDEPKRYSWKFPPLQLPSLQLPPPLQSSLKISDKAARRFAAQQLKSI